MSDPRPTWLGLEPLIAARLAPVAAAHGAHVLSAADLAGATEASLPKPSLRIVYAGHAVLRPDGPAAPGFGQIEQTWLVVPAVRNVADIKSAAPARRDASPLVDAVWDALDGWNPGSGYGRLVSVTPPSRPLTLEGVIYVPLAFTTRFRRNPPCP